jgi:hypothetical protein
MYAKGRVGIWWGRERKCVCVCVLCAAGKGPRGGTGGCRVRVRVCACVRARGVHTAGVHGKREEQQVSIGCTRGQDIAGRGREGRRGGEVDEPC